VSERVVLVDQLIVLAIDVRPVVIAAAAAHHLERFDPAFQRVALRVAAIAAREGRTPDEVAYDYITEADNRYLYFPLVNYVSADHEPIREMLADSGTLLDLSDGGAHCTSIVDACMPSYCPTGGATGGADRGCHSNFWSSARPARPPTSSVSPTAAGSRPDCAPM
jgi:hypothetical protein